MKERMARPLQGIRVVELGTHVAVPNVSRILADWGAEVIKVEGVKGEEWRIVGTALGTPIRDDENPIFALQNSNKQFIAVNLKTESGHRIMEQLWKRADIFISNLRLPALEKMRLDYGCAKEVNPSLIYVHFTGFGYHGPDCAKPGFDMAAFWGKSGALVDWVSEGDFPIKPMPGFGDSCVASILAAGTLAALYARTQTGKGTFLSSSLYSAAVWYNASGVLCTQEPYSCKYPLTKYLPEHPTCHNYLCGDGEWLVLTVIDYDRQWPRLCELLGIGQYAADERYCSLAHLEKSAEHKREVVELLDGAFAKKTSGEWAEIFSRNDIVYSVLTHMKDIASDPQAWANQYLERVKFQSGTELALPTVPVEFMDFDTKGRYDVPGRIGRDTEEILGQLGYSGEEIARLKDEKAVI